MPRKKQDDNANQMQDLEQAFSTENDPKPEQDTIKPEYELIGAITADYDKLADTLAPHIADRFLARLSAGVRREIIAKSQQATFSDDCIAAINNGSMNGIRSITGV